jgi:hypothetical protein
MKYRLICAIESAVTAIRHHPNSRALLTLMSDKQSEIPIHETYNNTDKNSMTIEL